MIGLGPLHARCRIEKRRAGERVGDQFARFGNAIERNEGAKARSTFFAEQHLIEHVEEIIGDAGMLRHRALGVEVLITRHSARDVVQPRLNGLGAGVAPVPPVAVGGELGGDRESENAPW